MQVYSDTNAFTVQKSIEQIEGLTYTYDYVSPKVMMNGITIQSPRTVIDNFQDLFDQIQIYYVLDTKYNYRPEALQKELYGTTELWYILLQINGMFDHSQFVGDQVKIIRPDRLDIIQDIVSLFKDELDQEKHQVVDELTIKPVIL